MQELDIPDFESISHANFMPNVMSTCQSLPPYPDNYPIFAVISSKYVFDRSLKVLI